MNSSIIPGPIPFSIRGRYRAAGILPYAFHEGTVYVLLGCEDRTKKNKRVGEVWLHFGGKKLDSNPQETHPATTAIREFHEETGGLFPIENTFHWQSVLMEETCQKIWYERGKYVLFFLPIPFDEDLPQRFAKLDKSELKEIDQSEIKWIPLPNLIESVSQFSSDPESEVTISIPSLTSPLRIWNAFVGMLRVPGVIHFLQSLLTAAQMEQQSLQPSQPLLDPSQPFQPPDP